MMKLTAIMLLLLFANVSGGKISSLPEQDLEGKFYRWISIFLTSIKIQIQEICMTVLSKYFFLLVIVDRAITTCSGFDLYQMPCNCYADLWNIRKCKPNSNLNKANCISWETSCNNTGKNKRCCAAIECYMEKRGCF